MFKKAKTVKMEKVANIINNTLYKFEKKKAKIIKFKLNIHTYFKNNFIFKNVHAQDSKNC